MTLATADFVHRQIDANDLVVGLHRHGLRRILEDVNHKILLMPCERPPAWYSQHPCPMFFETPANTSSPLVVPTSWRPDLSKARSPAKPRSCECSCGGLRLLLPRALHLHRFHRLNRPIVLGLPHRGLFKLIALPGGSNRTRRHKLSRFLDEFVY